MKIARLAFFFFLLSPLARAEWTHQTVEGAGEVPLNVVTAGNPESPPILFIHGIGQSHYSFVHQLNSDLANDFFLVTFDLRGHGASGKPWAPEAYQPRSVWADDVDAVIEATGIQKPVVMAWSYGTLVLMDYIRERGADNLVAINLTGALGSLVPVRLPTNDPNTEEFLRLRKLRQSPNLADKIRASEGMSRWLTATPMADDDKRLFDAISQMLPAYARTPMMQRPFNNEDLLDGLDMPVLLSLGSEDNPLQLEDGAALAKGHKNISLSVFEGAGHSVFFEQPERFNRELRTFVEASLRAHETPEP
ncbi:MAG: alpha/beta hydrolase [Pseudomonadota bacterium]